MNITEAAIADMMNTAFHVFGGVGPVGTVILRNRQQRGSEPTTRCDLGFGLFILNSDRAGTHARSDTKETE
jgi:hypothetical protein